MLKADFLSTRAFRAASAFTLVISLATSLAFAAIFILVRRADTTRISSILVYEVNDNMDADEAALRKALAARLTRNIRRIDYLALFDRDGRPVFGNLSRMPVSSVDGSSQGAEVSTPPGVDGPAVFVARRRPDGDVLVMGRDLSDSNQVQGILLRVLTAAVIPTAGAALLVGLGFARQSRRRLDSVQNAIARIIDGDMTSRLPTSPQRDEIDRIAQAVNAMLDEIGRLLSQLTSVGDNIAHDLRAPLAVARLKIERALAENEEGDESLAKQLEAALTQLDRASVTIDALLRISAVEGGQRRKQFADVDLAKVCRETFAFFEPVAQQKSIYFAILAPTPTLIRGDVDLIREAISNLVDNALKFTPSGGEVRIACGVHDEQPFIEVVDSGPGVPSSEREKIFERLYRGETHEGSAGHGIGLSIAQTIAQLHGFVLRVEDSTTGARFVMRASTRAILALDRTRSN